MQKMFEANRADDHVALVHFLAGRLRCSGKQAKRLLDDRVVFVNGKRTWMAKHDVKSGDRVEVFSAEKPPSIQKISLIYQDADIVVANKPAGLMSNGAGSLENALRQQLNLPGLRAIHRLDRDTTGCLILGKRDPVIDLMIGLFETGRISKTYRVIVSGHMSGNREIRSPIDDRPAHTLVHVLSANRIASFLSVNIETGRTHQIRKHLAGIRHPVLGDKIYLTGGQELPMLRSVPRQMLHAYSLSFPHPVTGVTVRCEAPLPGDFRVCLKALKLS